MTTECTAVDEVVQKVAAHHDADVLDLPPLFEHFDSDALNKLFEPLGDGSGRNGTFSFTYCSLDVTVSYRDGDRTVELEPTDEYVAAEASRAIAE